MKTFAEKTIKDRWKKLDSKRDIKLDKARAASALTIPTLLPPKSFVETDNQYQTYSSIQARGVTSLASKILTALLPLNDLPNFKFGIKNGREPSVEIAEYLDKLSFQVYRKIVSKNFREMVYLALQYTIVVGDCLLVMDNEFNFRVIRLDNYVVRRDVTGEVQEVIYLEFISRSNDEEVDAGSFFSQGDDYQANYDTVYIRLSKQDDGSWYVEKEIEDEIFETGTYKVLPYFPIRWASVAGEDFGRSHVEDIYGDILSLETFTKSHIKGMAAASTFFMGVDPSGLSEIDDLTNASNGDWVAARKQDVFVISPSETMNPQLQASAAAVENLRKEVGAGFLLQSAAIPSGDRVTATAIRAIGTELETVLGGVFSSLARDLMVPIVKRSVYIMLETNQIDARLKSQFDSDNGILDVEIITGLQALSRESDLTKLLQMGEMVRNLPPQAQASFKWESYARALITSLGFDAANWVKSPEEIKREQMDQAQAQHKMEMDKIMGQAMAGAAQNYATSDIEKTGGQNIPPQMLNKAMDMFNLGGMQSA